MDRSQLQGNASSEKRAKTRNPCTTVSKRWKHATIIQSRYLHFCYGFFFSQTGKELVVAGECEGILTHLGC